MNDMTSNPFGDSHRPDSVAQRQVAARENSEVLALLYSARTNPRDPRVATDRIRNSFARVTLAASAQYAYARGTSEITGPSIRAAEAMRLDWGHLAAGWSELARSQGPDGVGISEVEAFCVDYETGNRESIKFVLRHWRDTKQGGYALKDERDIYELCANQAQRRKRACILAMLPGDVVEMAMDQAAATLKAKTDTSPEALAKMLEAFEPFGITKDMIEKRIQRRLDAIAPAQMISLKRIYASLRDEMSTPADWFELSSANGSAPAAPSTTDAAAIARQAAAKRRADKAAEKAAGIKTAADNIGDTSMGAGQPAESPAASPSSPAGEVPQGQAAPAPAQLEQMAAQILNSPDRESAALVLDAMRSLNWPQSALDELARVYHDCWTTGS